MYVPEFGLMPPGFMSILTPLLRVPSVETRENKRASRA